MRRYAILIFCALVIAAGILYALLRGEPVVSEIINSETIATTTASSYGDDTNEVSDQTQPIVRIGGRDVRVLLADTPAKRTQGLSGRSGLGENEGMLFIFPEEGMYGFWMKDMNFSIDIIWIDSDGKVVHIAKSASPDSYPTSFSPPKPARYVLEVRAGFAEQYGVGEGDAVAFSNL